MGIRDEGIIIATYIVPPVAVFLANQPHSSMAHPHLCSFVLQQMIIYLAFRDPLSYFQGNLATYVTPFIVFL